MKQRFLAVLLTVCLTASFLPAGALAEADAIVSEPVEAEVAAAEGETGAPGLIIESDGAEPDPSEEDREALLFAAAFGEAASEEPAEADAVSEVEAAPVVLGEGQSLALSLDGFSDGEGAVLWSVLDGEIASVSETGVITGLAVGDTRATGTSESGETVAFDVSVRRAPDAVSLNLSAMTIGVGEYAGALIAAVGTGDAEYAGDVTFSSGSRKVVTVDENGGVRGVKKGTATVTATTWNGLSASCKVTVKAAPKKTAVSPAKLALSVGISAALAPSVNSGAASFGYTYETSEPGIAAVDAEGVVTAVGPGAATIAVRSYNGKAAKCAVTVTGAPATVVPEQERLTVAVGQALAVGAIALDAEGQPTPARFTFSVDGTSEDPACIAIDAESGVLTGLRKGSAVVNVAAHSGASASVRVVVAEAPADIALSEDAVTVGTKERYEGLAVSLTPPEGEEVCAAVLTWRSSNAKVARVDANGAVTGVKRGTATITVATQNGIERSVKVTVKSAPGKLTASPTKVTLGVGESRQLGYKLPSGTFGRVTWTSGNPNVAAVDPETGVATAVSPGTAKLTAMTYNKKKATVTVTVKEAPQTLTLSAGQLLLGVGEKTALKASLNDGAAGEITYAAESVDIAAVKDGTVTGVAPGETEIAVETYNGLRAVCAVTVKPAPEAVTLPFAKLTLGVGNTLALEPDIGDAASALTYATSNKKIVSVSAAGVIKGAKAGTATVTVKTFNNKRFKLSVTVKKAPGSVTVTPARRDLGVGERFTPGYKLPSGTAGTVTFESTDDGILAVDAQSGEVTALAEGAAEVVVRTFNGKESRCAVTVHAAPDAVDAGVDRVELGVGQVYAVAPALPEGTYSDITYESADPAVAAVSAAGEIKAVGRGETTVRVMTYLPDVYAEISVGVWDAPSSVRFEESAVELNIGERLALRPVIPEGSRTAFAFASSDERVASVSDEGVVEALARGVTTLTATAHNGLKATLRLTVYDPSYPEVVLLVEPIPAMKIGDSVQALVQIKPETAETKLTWSSSNENAATVDPQGVIRAVGRGYANITAVSDVNENAKLAFTVAVEVQPLTLVIPARTTDIAGIPANLEKIDAIRACAVQEIDRLEAAGTITAKDATKRRSMVNNIFRSYAFAWMTPKKQKYWRAANSENGLKDFKPGVVYYGLPYISGSGANRTYTVDKALSENRYTDSGEGYYLLNQKKYLGGRYVGNDCSGLCNTAIWGTGSSHTSDRTKDIIKISAYNTVKSFSNMRPGDLICKGSAHVVMFLYYANPEKTQFMMIENGGAEKGTNTVHCDVHTVSYYSKRGYKVRRLASLGK